MREFASLFNSLGSELGIKLPLPLSFSSVQKGLRITATFACGWVGSKGSSYQLNSPEWQDASYITFTFACFIPQNIKLQSCVAARCIPRSSFSVV